MTGPVRVVALLQTQPGRGADQLAAFEALAPVVRAEDGCLQYDLHTVAADPDGFVVIERWASAQALAAHAGSDHMRASSEASAAFRTGKPEVIVLSDEPVA